MLPTLYEGPSLWAANTRQSPLSEAMTSAKAALKLLCRLSSCGIPIATLMAWASRAQAKDDESPRPPQPAEEPWVQEERTLRYVLERLRDILMEDCSRHEFLRMRYEDRLRLERDAKERLRREYEGKLQAEREVQAKLRHSYEGRLQTERDTQAKLGRSYEGRLQTERQAWMKQRNSYESRLQAERDAQKKLRHDYESRLQAVHDAKAQLADDCDVKLQRERAEKDAILVIHTLCMVGALVIALISMQRPP